MAQRQALILGDSHVHAMKRACKARGSKAAGLRFKAYRFSKLKNGVDVGDVSYPKALEMIAALSSDDIVISALGGNQHSVVGLVQHPIPFGVFEPGVEARSETGLTWIPYNALWSYFERGLRGKDGERLVELRRQAKCSFYHLAPPPPKMDDAHILKRYESDFDKLGIRERGLSPTPLRRALWNLQVRVQEQLCKEWDIRFLPAPSESLSPEGFLKADYYADDATHANAAYGELVLRQVESIALKSSAVAGSNVTTPV